MTNHINKSSLSSIWSRPEQRLIMHRLHNREAGAFSEVIEKTIPHIIHFAWIATLDENHTNHIVEATYRTFFKTIRRYDSSRTLVQLLVAMLVNNIFKTWKQTGNAQRSGQEPAEIGALKKLRMHSRLVFLLHVRGATTKDEIARLLHQHVKQIEPEITRVRKHLYDAKCKSEGLKLNLKKQKTAFKTLLENGPFEKPELDSDAGKHDLTNFELAVKLLKGIEKKIAFAGAGIPKHHADMLAQNCISYVNQSILKPVTNTEKVASFQRVIKPFFQTKMIVFLLILTFILFWQYRESGEFVPRFVSEWRLRLNSFNFLATTPDTTSPAKDVSTGDILSMTWPDSLIFNVPGTIDDSADDGQLIVQTRGVEKKRERSGAITMRLPNSPPINDYTAVSRKQEMIDDVDQKIFLWQDYLSKSNKEELYRPHAIQNLAQLYMQAAKESRGELFRLADAVAWIEQNDNTLQPMWGHSHYQSKLDSLRAALRQARIQGSNQ